LKLKERESGILKKQNLTMGVSPGFGRIFSESQMVAGKLGHH
jgi:hypothetical protein